MRRLLVLCTALAALAATAGPAGAATNECRGLQVCVPVTGPWVLVPARQSAPRPQVQFQLSCPKGYIVGGFDAELSDRSIDVAFLGTMGAPVNPGITTGADAVFVGTYVGGARKTVSFRPHIGCMPTRGGGSRTPTAAVFPPGKPLVRHVVNAAPPKGRSTIVAACAAGERIVDAKSAITFVRDTPPDEAVAGEVSLVQAIKGDRTAAAVRRGAIPVGTRAVIQVAAICAGRGK